VPLAYFDASALVKLVRSEAESQALWQFFTKESSPVTSVVGAVEVRRALRREEKQPDTALQAEEILRRIVLVELTPEIAGEASMLEPTSLRALDAIHLATALSLGDALSDLVVYDRRLADAARATGLNVVSPGMSA
jgi:uncharacterized protein